jgi:hypothetical protein
MSATAAPRWPHTPQWNSDGTAVDYGINDLDKFSVGDYGYCKLGNWLDHVSINKKTNDYESFGLRFNHLTLEPWNSATQNDPKGGRLFVIKDGNRMAFPANAIWHDPTQTNRGDVIFDSWFSYSVDHTLYRYFSFRDQLTDPDVPVYPDLPTGATKAVIVIHGWNPDSNKDPYKGNSSDDHWQKLKTQLESKLASTNWAVCFYILL